MMLLFHEVSADGGTHTGTWQLVGFRASAPVTMVLEEDSMWITDQQGARHALAAPGVVVWETGALPGLPS